MDRVIWLIEGIASGGPAAASALVFVVFGASIAWLLGLRIGLLVVVAAVPVGIGALIVSSQVVGAVGIETAIPIHALMAIGMAALVAVARRVLAFAPDPMEGVPQAGKIVWAGAGIGGAIAVGVWLAGIGDFSIPPQGTDDIWHGYVVERLTAVPRITVDRVVPLAVTSDTPVGYYQYGLHLAAALLHETTQISVAEALNAAWLVIVGLLLPFGLAALAWQLVPERPWVAVAAAVISPSVVTFPYLTNGILPYTAALAMVPAFLALLLALVDGGRSVPPAVVALAALGIFVTHPTGAVATAVLAGLLVIERLIRARGSREVRTMILRLATASGLAAVLSLPWILATGGVGLGASVAERVVPNVPQAALMFAGLGSPWTPIQPIVAGITWLGVATTFVLRRAIGLAAAFLAFGAVYIGSLAGMPGVDELTGPWHADWHRLVAVIGLTVPLLAGLGLTVAVTLASRLAGPRGLPRQLASVGVVGLVVLSIVGVAAAYDTARAQSIVRTAWHARGLVRPDDIRLFRELASHVGPDETVLASPIDGSSWMYPVAGLTPVLPYPTGSALHVPDMVHARGPFADDAATCSELLEIGAGYAVAKEVRGDDPAGDYDIARLVARIPEVFTLVAETDGAHAYRIERAAAERCAAARPPAS